MAACNDIFLAYMEPESFDKKAFLGDFVEVYGINAEIAEAMANAMEEKVQQVRGQFEEIKQSTEASFSITNSGKKILFSRIYVWVKD